MLFYVFTPSYKERNNNNNNNNNNPGGSRPKTDGYMWPKINDIFFHRKLSQKDTLLHGQEVKKTHETHENKHTFTGKYTIM